MKANLAIFALVFMALLFMTSFSASAQEPTRKTDRQLDPSGHNCWTRDHARYRL
jgi:hypothetical protein